MSIDYANVTGLSDHIGNIVKITDIAGNVLWSAVKMANLTITSFWDGMDGDTARIIINSPSPFAPDPSNPTNKVTTWTAYVYDLFDQQNRTIKIPVGSTIECYITRDKENADSYIKLNGVNVATGEGTYVYTVIDDATIDVSEDYVQGDFGVISIVGAVTYISFTINGDTYQAIEGMTWNGWFTSSYNTTGKTKGDVENIKDANGNAVSLDTVIVGGTAYEVGFAPPVATITLKGDFAYSGVRYNGVYYGSGTVTPVTFTANVGDEIVVESYGYEDSPIYLNGKLVANEPSETEYYYTVVSDAVITAYAWGSGYSSSSEVSITDENA